MTKRIRTRSGIGYDPDLKWKLKVIAAKRKQTLEDLVNEQLWIVVRKDMKTKGRKKK